MLGFCVLVLPFLCFLLFSLFLFCLLGPDGRYLDVRVNVCSLFFLTKSAKCNAGKKAHMLRPQEVGRGWHVSFQV